MSIASNQFPIMRPIFLRDQRALREAGVEMVDSIPWSVIQPHERQAVRNHCQTLERLAERGGLSASEAVAILEDRQWAQMDKAMAYRHLARLVQSHTSAVRDVKP